jgi:hypothetical protein
MIARFVRIAGLAAFAVAFFLPAVRERSNVYEGWQCAAITLGSVIHPFEGLSVHVRAVDVLAGIPFILDGWVNPLMAAYLIMLMFRGFLRTRRVLSCAILVCLISCWVVIGTGLVPLIGHFLWAGGILLILSPEFLGLFRVQNAK